MPAEVTAVGEHLQPIRGRESVSTTEIDQLPPDPASVLRDICDAGARAKVVRISRGGSRARSVRCGHTGRAAAWLASERWPFHGLRAGSTEADVRAAVAAGEFSGRYEPFVLGGLRDDRVGLLPFRYLDEPSPDVDVAVLKRFRGRGVGTAMVNGRRRTLSRRLTIIVSRGEEDRTWRCGGVRPLRVDPGGDYRASWPDGEGGSVDSVGYAILRSDWPGSRADMPPVDVPERWHRPPRAGGRRRFR